MSEDTRSLPLFPLGTVLFPGMLLPLHIFEDRYREMIGACLVTDRTFGVLLIHKGLEVGEPAEPYEVGTLARILDVERQPDGRMNIVTLGIQRFRLIRLLEQKPFLVGRVSPLEQVAAEQIDPALATAVANRFRAYVRDLHGEEAERRPLELSQDPETLSFQIAAALGIDARQRQGLLELTSTTERLRTLRELIGREHEAFRVLGRTAPARVAGPVSPN